MGRKKKTVWDADTLKKYQDIISMRKDGNSLKKIAISFGLSAERIRQILNSHNADGRIRLNIPAICKECGRKFNAVRADHGFCNRKCYDDFYDRERRRSVHSKKIPLIDDSEKDNIIAMYNDKRMSVREIAEHYGVHFHTARRYMNKFRINRRTPGRTSIAIDEIRHLYLTENKTASEVAEILGKREQTIKHYLWRHNLRKADRGKEKA